MIDWLGDESSSVRVSAKEVILVAVAYHLLAQIGLYFAIPPGFATVFWPASGVALAAVLMRGPWMMLGVLLGSFSVNLYISLQLNSQIASVTTFVVAFGIACSSALQAGLGAWLIELWLKRQNGRLAKLRHLLVLVGLGGPVGCVVAATGGTSILLATGVMASSQWWHNWVMWWLGDTLGVVVVAPALIILAQSEKSVSSLRKSQVCIPLAVLFILLAFGYSRFEAHTLERFEAEIDNLTDNAYLDVQGKLMDYERSIVGVVSLYRSSDSVTDREFDVQTRPLINSSPSLVALQWVPRVSRDELPAFIEDAKQKLSRDYKVHDTNNTVFDGSSEREVYYPVRYIRPLEENSVVLGFDMYSSESRRQVVELALNSGRSVASAPIKLLQSTDETGFLIIFPQHPGKSKNLVVGVFKIKPIFRTVTHQLASFPLDLMVTDANSSDEVFRWGNPANSINSSADDMFSVVKTVSFGQRTWIMTFNPPVEFVSDYTYRHMAPVLIAAVAFIGLLSLFILSTAVNAMVLEDELQSKEANLQDEENFLITVLDNLPSFVEVREAENLSCVKLNRLAREFWQLSDSEVGLGYQDLYDPDEALFQEEEDRRTINSGNIVELNIRKVTTPHGDRWLKTKKVPIVNRQNDIKYVLSIYDDVTEQKEEHETFNAVVEELPSALLIVNEYSRIEYANPAAYNKFPLDSKLTPLNRIIPENSHHKHAELFKKFMAQPESKRMAPGRDLRAVNVNGDEIPVEVTLASIRWRGRPCVMALVIDLSDRMRAEQAEIEAKHFFSSLLNDMGESIWSVNTEGQATFVNPALCKILGYSADELIGKNVDHIIGGQTATLVNVVEGLNPVYVAMHKQEKIVARNKTLARKDGLTIPVDYIVTPQINLTGVVVGAVVVAADVSDRVVALDKLQAQHELISLGLDASGLGSWQWNASNNQIVCDDNLHRIFGLPLESFHGGYKEFLALVHPDDRDRVEEVTNRFAHTTDLYEIIYRIVRADDAVRWIHVCARYVVDEHGEPIKMQGVAWDCTGEKTMELALRQNEKVLESANEKFIDYSKMISEKVLSPALQAAEIGEVLIRTAPTLSLADVMDTLKDLQSINVAVAKKLRDLELYAKIVGTPLKKHDVETVDIINRMLDTLLPEFKVVKVDCRVETPLPNVVSNVECVEEVFKRLIDNAVTHNNSDVKKVRIGCTTLRGEAMFYVAGNGTGMPVDEQQGFSDTTGQLERLYKPKTQTLSLKLVAAIIEKHGGKLWVESNEKEGAIVYFGF